jgi:hypothetical protein
MHQTLLIVALGVFGLTIQAFQPRPAFIRSQRPHMMSDSGGVEIIEFKIYPDGRVEETVRGIRGNNCHKVTEAINEALGKVIDSAPTEEMYEQGLVIDETISLTQGNTNGWDGSSTW